MTVKRRWSGSSSSHLAAESAANAAANPTTVVRTAGEPPQSKILTIGYPVGGGENDQLKIEGFLERCHYCKKRIAKYSEVFMYGNLRAFCSAECRDNQIAMDHLAKEQPANPKEKVVGGQGAHKAKCQLRS